MRSTHANFDQWQQVAATGQMVGENRPVGRVTVANNKIQSLTSDRPGPWRYLQHQSADEVEVPFVQSIEWDRSLSDDCATCTITIFNGRPMLDAPPEGIDVSPGNVGYLTFNRGTTSPVSNPSVYNRFVGESGAADSFPTEWGYSKSAWFGKLIPNRLIRTYEGYGSDNFDDMGNLRAPGTSGYVSPGNDSKLIITGTWLIDSVEISGGLIVLHCRDVGKILLEQVVYPTMIPMERFPLTFCPEEAASGSKSTTKRTLSKNQIKYHSAALELHQSWYSGGYMFGHHGKHAFDGSNDTFFLSHSYPWDTDTSWAREWLQGTCSGNKINKITITPLKAGLVVFISIQEKGVWQGANTIDYSWNNHNHHANIPYVLKTTLGGTGGHVIKLPRAYDAQLVRFTFTKLQDYGSQYYGEASSPFSYKYRAAIKEITAVFDETVKTPDTYQPSTIGVPGYINDWSNAVTELVGWAGFTWPVGRRYQDGGPAGAGPNRNRFLGIATTGEHLRPWGDIEYLGAGPIVCSPSDFLLNHTFMEAVKIIADFIGAIFFIDEYGSVQFRLPNILSGGNTVLEVFEHDRNTKYNRRSWPIEFHEDANLLEYSVSVDDSQIRSEVLVVGAMPDTNASMPVTGGVVLSGQFSDVLAGQTRLFLVPGDQTKLFGTEEECQRMAELIGIRLLFSYRKGSAKIVGHPGLQLDDQVRIFERVSNENNVHYVSGISSHLDNLSGSYTMDVTTHWLGDDPDTDWFLDKVTLTPAVMQLTAVLRRLGMDT